MSWHQHSRNLQTLAKKPATAKSNLSLEHVSSGCTNLHTGCSQAFTPSHMSVAVWLQANSLYMNVYTKEWAADVSLRKPTGLCSGCPSLMGVVRINTEWNNVLTFLPRFSSNSTETIYVMFKCLLLLLMSHWESRGMFKKHLECSTTGVRDKESELTSGQNSSPPRTP